MDHTLGREAHDNPYHISILRSRLNGNLGVVYADVKDEIVTAFDDILNLEGHGKLRFAIATLNFSLMLRITRVEECPCTPNCPSGYQ